jgi:hypothetical protein
MCNDTRSTSADQGGNTSTLRARLDGAAGMLAAALAYHRLGICVVPQRRCAKAPCIRWGPYQDVRPSTGDLGYWFADRFPDAGIAIILGPVSGLIVVDVDGEDAHRELVARLGDVPAAPTVVSGSLKPYRYHLYFQHPVDIATRATYHPWHPQLEFRGYRGIVIAPPSMHRSGHRYRWADGRSLADLPPPELPGPILEALRAKAETLGGRAPGTTSAGTPAGAAARTSAPPRSSAPPARARAGVAPVGAIPGPLSPAEEARLDRRISFLTDLRERSRRFLFGDFENGPEWNKNLYITALDMRDCDYGLEEALPLLLHGARPWTPQDREAAIRTIHSAYSAARRPAR